MNRETLLKLHDEMCAKGKAIMQKKNHDYAGKGGESPFANFTRCEAMGICRTEHGILIRMCDKLSRLSTFADAGKLLVADEGVEDTLVDLVNYSILLAGYLRERGERKDARVEQHDVDLSQELQAIEDAVFASSDTSLSGMAARLRVVRKCVEPAVTA